MGSDHCYKKNCSTNLMQFLGLNVWMFFRVDFGKNSNLFNNKNVGTHFQGERGKKWKIATKIDIKTFYHVSISKVFYIMWDIKLHVILKLITPESNWKMLIHLSLVRNILMQITFASQPNLNNVKCLHLSKIYQYHVLPVQLYYSKSYVKTVKC